jgi:hypothetical protein
MGNPEHFKMGMNNEKFSHAQFWSWIITGWLEAFLIFTLCYW